MNVNPFSFRGEIGRGRFWLMLIIAMLVSGLSDALPVDNRVLVAKHFGGESSVGYMLPLSPALVSSWVVCAIAYALTMLFLWLTAAAVVQRLRQLGISWKRAALFLAGFVISIALDFAFPRPASTFTVIDGVLWAIMMPTCFLGAVGFFMTLFVKGRDNRHADMPDNDGRKPLP